MPVSEHDVRHVATLARIALHPERVPDLVAELNGILGHMEVLSRVDTTQVQPVSGVAAGGMPLRTDDGLQLPLARARDTFVPSLRDGFIVVPRLASHESAPASADAGGAGDLGRGGGEVPA